MTASSSATVLGARVVLVAAAAFGVLGAKLRLRYGQDDALFVARCEAKCWQVVGRSSCVKSCLSKGGEKPGFCPSRNITLSPFAAVCMKTCYFDTECPNISKCCRHSCGVTCKPPQHLDSVVGLPKIPKDVKVLKGRRKRTITIEWTPGETSYLDEGGGTVLYLIEERHYAGRYFIESSMTDWTPCSRTIKRSQVMRHFVKPGRWYQFRVAAVNENGTKGYSENSLPFSASITPKPPKAPQNMTVGPLIIRNGSVSTELKWSAPPSDLPLQKYKVFWSRRLHGAKALDSVLVHQQVVPRDQTYFLLQNLQPNSMYFLQVQALVQFGKERLKGEKSGLVLNTTNYSNVSDNSLILEEAFDKRIEGLQLEKLFWSKSGLKAKIVWKARKQSMYTITWWSGPCRENSDGYSHIKLNANTTTNEFILYELQFNCRYRVSVREMSSRQGKKSTQDTSITFATPKCSAFKSSHKKIRCH